MKWVVGNWKSNGTPELRTKMLDMLQSVDADTLEKVNVVLCPPATLLEGAIANTPNAAIGFGGQNLSAHERGAYTGEIASAMLHDIGAKYVLIGHSERRALFNEDTKTLVAKLQQAVANDLKPIFCIGEPLEEREAGQHLDYITQQIEQTIEQSGIDIWEHALLAYEPIWAIGTGKTASNEQIDEMHDHIRNTFAKHSATIARNLPLLYGGSVNADNGEAIFALDNVDGGLIGGASLKPDTFNTLIQLAHKSAS